MNINNVNALQIFRVLRYGAVILISILLAKSSLSTADISTYEWLLYIGTAVTFFWVNGYLDAVLPMYPTMDSEKGRTLLFNVFLQFLGFTLFIVMILVLGKNWIIPLMTGREALPFYDLYCWFLVFHIPSHLVEYYYLLNNRAKEIVGFGIFSFGLQIVVVILPVFLGYGLEWSFKMLILLAILKCIWLLFVIFKYTRPKINLSLLKPYNIVAVPLIGYAFVGGFATLFDNWLVGWWFEDADKFAIFRYGARELPLATALVGGLYTAMVPEVSKNLGNALTSIKEKSLTIYHWLFPISIVLMLLSPFLFPLVFNPDFKESASIFNIYLLIMISRVMLPYTIAMGLKETRAILGVSLLEMLINIVLSLIFVQFWSLEGIAIATVIAFLFEKISLSAFLYYKYDIKIKDYTNMKWLVFYSSVLIIAFVVSQKF